MASHTVKVTNINFKYTAHMEVTEYGRIVKRYTTKASPKQIVFAEDHGILERTDPISGRIVKSVHYSDRWRNR
jgi:hypothetical protein